jgi:hypothetical protein
MRPSRYPTAGICCGDRGVGAAAWSVVVPRVNDSRDDARVDTWNGIMGAGADFDDADPAWALEAPDCAGAVRRRVCAGIAGDLSLFGWCWVGVRVWPPVKINT